MHLVRQHHYEAAAAGLLSLALAVKVGTEAALDFGPFARHTPRSPEQWLLLALSVGLLLLFYYGISRGNQLLKALYLLFYVAILTDLFRGQLTPTGPAPTLKAASLVAQHGLQGVAALFILLSMRRPLPKGPPPTS